MSVKAVQAAVDTAAPSLAAKLVMMVLAYHHNGETGLCFPSYERMAEETGLNKSSVIRAVKELETANLLRKRKGRRAGSHSAPNHYTLVFMHARVIEIGKKRFSGADSRALQPKQEQPTSQAKALEVANPAKRARSHKRLAKRRIEPTWRPSPQALRAVKAEGFTDPEVERMILDFRDYYTARGEISAVWGLDWSRWVRRQVDMREADNGRRTGTPTERRGAERQDAIRRSHVAAMAAVHGFGGRSGSGPPDRGEPGEDG